MYARLEIAWLCLRSVRSLVAFVGGSPSPPDSVHTMIGDVSIPAREHQLRTLSPTNSIVSLSSNLSIITGFVSLSAVNGAFPNWRHVITIVGRLSVQLFPSVDIRFPALQTITRGVTLSTNCACPFIFSGSFWLD